MPIDGCQIGGKPGFKAGPTGKCFPYEPKNEQSREMAYNRALAQLRAIEASKHSEGK